MDLFKILGTVAVDINDAMKAFKKIQGEGGQTESKLGKVFSGIGKGAAVAGKAIGTGLLAGSAAVAGLATAAIKSYSDYEQLVGGVETLFGTRGAESVQEYAELVGKSVSEVEAEFGMLQQAQSDVMANAANAYKDAGMSANEYMETVNGFAAALNQSSASQLESAELANQAVIDMSDNANKMGTDIELIKNAYGGFAKGNFTMLDNLKLGYGGTKTEMERLLADAEKISGIKYDISSFADITEAIHVMQEEMGIAGTTATEASTTIQGSLGMLKGAWSNLLTGFSDPDADLGALIDNVFSSVVTFAENLIPRVTQVLTGIATAIQQLVPMLASELPNVFEQVLPALIQGAIALINGLISALPSIISALQSALPLLLTGLQTLIVGLTEAIIAALPLLIEAAMTLVDALVGALPMIVQSLVMALPTLIPQLIDALVSMVMMLVENLPTIMKILIAALPGIIISIVEALVNNLPILIQGAIQLIMGIVTAIPQIIQALVGAIPTIVSLLVQAVLENLPAIIMGLIQVVLGIVVALPQILGSLIAAVPLALSGIWDGIANVFSNLGEWFGEKFSAAKDWAVNAWSDAKEKWTGIKNKVTDAFSSVGSWFKDKFAEGKKNAEASWSDAKEKWTNIKNKVAEGFSDFGNKIKEKFTDAKTKAQNAWNDAKDKFSGVKDKVVSAFSNLKDNVSPLFSKAKDNALKTWSTVKGSFEKIKNGDIVGAFNDLGSMLKGKFTTALNTAKKAFDKAKTIGKDLVTGLWNGVSDKFSWLVGKLKSFCSNVTDKIKAFFGIHSPSKETAYDGAMLAEGLAVGIKKNKSKAEQAAEDMASDVLSAASERLDTFKVYNEMSLAEEAKYWDAVRVQIKEGTKARVDADKKYFEAQKAAEKEAEDARKKAAEDAQKAEDAWLKKAEKDLDILKTYNNISLAEEAEYWDKIRVQRKEGTDSRLELDKKYFAAKKAAEDAIITDAEKWLKNHKKLHRVTTEEEQKYWEKIIQQCEEGSEAWEKADEKIYESKQNIVNGLSDQSSKLVDWYGEMNDAASEFADSMAAIQGKIDSQTQSILGSFDLFEKYTGGNSKPVSRMELIGNLGSQVKALEMWQDELSILESKIGGTALFEEIKGMGVEALSQVQEINKMTTGSLDEYAALYDKRTELADKQAKSELKNEIDKDTQEAYQKFMNKTAELGETIQTIMGGVADVSQTAFETVGIAVMDSFDVIKTGLGEIKTFFETWSPDIKLPHITMEGNLDIQEAMDYDDLPSFSVEWYSKAMNNATVLKKPTIFGYDQTSGRYLGGGEAGSEVVAGSSTLMSMIKGAVAEQNSTITYYMQKVIQMMASFFPQLIDALDVDIVLDSGVLVGELAVPMNNALGKLTNRKDRGR